MMLAQRTLDFNKRYLGFMKTVEFSLVLTILYKMVEVGWLEACGV